MNWQIVSNFIKSIPVGRYWREALLVLCAVVIAFFWMQLRATHLQKRIDDQNVAALADTVRTVRNRAGEAEQVRLALVADAKKLREINSGLAQEVAKEKGRVAYLTRMTATASAGQVTVPTISGVDTADSLKRPVYSWSHFEQGKGWARFLAGRSRFDSTEITQDSIVFDVFSGLEWNADHKLQMYARCSWPAVKFTGLDGVLLDEKMFLKADNRTWWARNRKGLVVGGLLFVGGVIVGCLAN